jgi:hypothetical protein
MKKSFSILMLSAILYFLPGWNGTFAQVPLNFQGSIAYNPVLPHGGMSSWEAAIFIPYAFVHEGTFYIFYSGLNTNWITGIGFATSADGYSFTKYTGNPVFTPSVSGFDSYNVTAGIVIEGQTGWIMYYNGREVPGFGPGPSVGRAMAPDLTGPWTRDANPVLTVGSYSEWDDGFISPNNVLPLDTGGFIMFYGAGDAEYSPGTFCQIGMATSPDGIIWTKYDDPSTINPPYAESDPVLKVGDQGHWDDKEVWLCNVHKNGIGYQMYYTGSQGSETAIGYAYSPDGIFWTKFASNPVYTINDDPYAVGMGYPQIVEQPAIVYDYDNNTAFMYYDYGITYPGEISMATAELPIGVRELTKYKFRITNFPNPVNQSTTFSYTLKEPVHVTIQIFNGFGQMVAEPMNANQPKGEQKVTWNAGNLPEGICFYRIQAGKEVGGGKMVVY